MIHAGSSNNPTRVLLAGLIGNVMEWYDFAVYGYLAVTIGRLFFPSSDPSASLIGAFGAFAAGFLVRPLGGVVFGRIGDLSGRRRALSLSVITMAVRRGRRNTLRHATRQVAIRRIARRPRDARGWP